MNKCKDKKEIIALYEKLAKNYYIETNSMELTLYYLEKLKLKDEDYEKIIEQIENKKKYKICTTETEKIIKLLSKKLNNYTLIDTDTLIERTSGMKITEIFKKYSEKQLKISCSSCSIKQR